MTDEVTGEKTGEKTGEPVTPVVIVGAGPCGLALACALLQQDVPVRVLDAAERRAGGSRAVLLWPPALEVFASLGVRDLASERGLPVSALTYHLTGGTRLRSALGDANAALLLPQEETARLLEERLHELGGRVEWSTRVTGVHPADDGVTVDAEGPDGVPFHVTADWLVGADGVRSTVRDLLGVTFNGGSVPGRYLVTEGEIEGSYERGVVHYFLRSTGSMVFAPLRGGTVRIGAPVDEDTPLTERTVQRLLDERGPGGLRIGRLGAVTTFASQERVAERFRIGRCFLVGDAAHTHSPIGGQGLNLGLQDVHNLAWKLGGVIGGRLSAVVLDTYGTERRQAAEQVVGNTRRAARMFLLGPVGARLRNAGWRLLEAGGVLRRWFTPLLAGRRMRYTTPLLPATAAEAGGTRPAATSLRARLLPAPGTRGPAWLPGPLTGAPQFRLLTLGAAASEVRRGARELSDRHAPLVRHDHTASRARTGFVLLRPDGFVAASGDGLEALGRVDALLSGLRR
ncbi:FAD-dependent oxidoreductase [Streptomyces sp. NPDC001663]|uniref:FAD-dependent oxidoreductase n=1 Tax=Streptomyces sp. NPDC001663 TaxID=3364597 RepID=UPI0036CA757B